MKYLLDTNMCIYIIKQKPVVVFKNFLSINVGDIGISSITLSELHFGVEKSQHKKKNLKALEEFIGLLEIVSFGEKAAEHYGKIRNMLQSQGNTIGGMDLLIAVHAKSQGLVLVTNNEKEFQRVKGLKVENWIK